MIPAIRKDDDIIHIETDGCIVNIRPGLYRNVQDEEDKISMTPRYEKVTSIEIYPDGRDASDSKYGWHIIDTDGKTLKQYAKCTGCESAQGGEVKCQHDCIATCAGGTPILLKIGIREFATLTASLLHQNT